MSFREKIAWASLLAHIVVFGLYFAALAPRWAAQTSSPDHGLGDMALAIAALIVLSIVFAIAAAASTPKGDVRTRFDEREKLIRLRAANVAGALVTIGVILVMNALIFDWNAVLCANLLLAVLVIAEIAKAAAQIVQFRTAI